MTDIYEILRGKKEQAGNKKKKQVMEKEIQAKKG